MSGKMVYDNIRNLSEFSLDYIELSEIDSAIFNEKAVLMRADGSAVQPQDPDKKAYDFVVFNYHPYTMAPTLQADKVRQLPMKCFSVVLEIEPGNAYALIPAEIFDALIVLDPTITRDERVWPFPRPLEGEPRQSVSPLTQSPRIGSFGFGTPGKGFDLLISAVNLEFDSATVRINIPPSSYADGVMATMHRRPYSEYLGDLCRRIAKPGIRVKVTHDFMSESELVDWCGLNDINCFMYTRRQSGLSATTDQAIVSGRPLLISANDTFRHIHPYVAPYPRTTIRDALAHSVHGVRRMQEDWSARAFGQQFLAMLQSFELLPTAEAKSINTVVTPASLQLRVLVATRRRPSPPTLLQWEERILMALRKSIFLQVETTTFELLSELETFTFWTAPDRVLILDEEAQVDIASMSLPPPVDRDLDRRPVLGCRRIAKESDGSSSRAKWTEIGPIIPFFTVLFQLAAGRPVIGCYGFEAAGSNLAEVVAKIQREVPSAEVRIHLTTPLPPPARAMLDWRLALLRAQLLPTPDVTISVMEAIPDVGTVMAILGQYSLNIFCDNGTDPATVRNLIDLAMAVDRPVCHTQVAPMPGYTEILPTIEGMSIAELLAGGVAAQAGAYNQRSEGRVLLSLENSLGVDPHPADAVTAPASLVKRPADSCRMVDPNGLIDPLPNTVAPVTSTQRHDQAPGLTVDERYRRETLPQQDFLINAIKLLNKISRPTGLLLVGDPARKSAITLKHLGYIFDHEHVIPDCSKIDVRRYGTIGFLNAISGTDELQQCLLFAADALVPGGYGVLTFFFGESYNVGQLDGNLDFPRISANDLRVALESVRDRLATVTTPHWWSDVPKLAADPFDLPSYGTLTLQRSVGAGGKGVYQYEC